MPKPDHDSQLRPGIELSVIEGTADPAHLLGDSFCSHDVSSIDDVTTERLLALVKKYPRSVSTEDLAQNNNEKHNSEYDVKKRKKSARGDTVVCVFYWFLVACIFALISFSIWLGVQISLKNNQLMASRGTCNCNCKRLTSLTVLTEEVS